MDKAAGLGLVFRDRVAIDVSQVAPPVTDSYREFAWGLYRFISRPIGPSAWRRRRERRPRRRASTRPSTARCSRAGALMQPTVRRTSWRRRRRMASIPPNSTARSGRPTLTSACPDARRPADGHHGGPPPQMAKEERCLFLTLGHATNQVNALWKLVIILTTMTRAIRRSEAGRRADPHIRQAHHRSDAGSLEADRRPVPQ